ncbi:MAG: carboxylesterase family protein [Desulfobacteraceae bacterium]|nr:carboxylesterase family protein [Desulfobacteraceae bacterium]
MKKLLLIVCFICFLATPALGELNIEGLRIESGLIKGTTFGPDNKGKIFFNIPYAAPPVGELRWRPPKPVEPWEGIRDGTERGCWCPQPPSPGLRRRIGPQSEDCLYLNVFTAAESDKERRPVMFWIHGGGHTIGSGNIRTYSGGRLARKKGVVVVAINYRLGPLGYLAHPMLSKESGHDLSGNYGNLDQIAALKWVRRNITAFGGDPNNITVFGESAGARSTSMLLVSPQAKGLFHRAIMQSGMGLSIIGHLKKKLNRPESYEDMGVRITKELGCEGADDVLACMRSKTPEEIIQATKPKAGLFGKGNKFGPVVDGYIWPDSIGYLYATGQHPDIPVMMGTNRDEGSYLIIPLRVKTVEEYNRILRLMSRGNEDHYKELVELFPVKRDDEVKPALNRLVTIATFHTAHRRAARLLSSNNKSKVYLYHFTRVVPIPRLKPLGAFHGMEIFYAFGNLGKNPHYEETDYRLSETMMSYWANFAKTGNPNGGNLPYWPAYSEQKDQHMELGEEMKPGTGLYRRECDLIDKIRVNLLKSIR